MINDPTALVYVKDFSESGSSRFFIKDCSGFRQVTAGDIGQIDSFLICHDFWLVRDEIALTGKLPNHVMDLDEVSAVASQKRNLWKLRDHESIVKKIPNDLLNFEKREQYALIFNKKIPIDIGILEQFCVALIEYAKKLIETAKTNDEYERLLSVELPVFNVLNQHSARGIRVDVDKIRTFRDTIQYEYYDRLKNFSDDFGVQPEIMSDKHLSDYIRSIGLSDAEVPLEYILEYIPIEGDFGPRMNELRKLRSAHDVLNELTLSDGWIYPIVDVFGTRTSRIIYRSPLLQNIAKRFRGFICPRIGKDFCYIDYDQFEVGIMAALSGDTKLKFLYDSGDMYALFAKQYLKKDDFRKQAKKLFLSYAYGMSKKAIIDAACELKVERDIAKFAFNQFACFEKWKNERKDEFNRLGRIPTSLGNYIVGEGRPPFSRKEHRSMISQCVQGTGSLIFKKAILKISEIRDVIITLPMHDAVLFEYSVPESREQVQRCMKDAMTEVLGNKVEGKASIGEFFVQ